MNKLHHHYFTQCFNTRYTKMHTHTHMYTHTLYMCSLAFMCTYGLPLWEEVRVNYQKQSYFSCVLSCSHVVAKKEQLASQGSWTLQRNPPFLACSLPPSLGDMCLLTLGFALDTRACFTVFGSWLKSSEIPCFTGALLIFPSSLWIWHVQLGVVGNLYGRMDINQWQLRHYSQNTGFITVVAIAPITLGKFASLATFECI